MSFVSRPTPKLFLLVLLAVAACGGGDAVSHDESQDPAAVPASASISKAEGNGETGTYPHTNRLIHEKSPYLLQHAHNPVDWYPWGEEAFAKAREEDKPIFLSIGYSTCHWCHVMERESFENEDIAAIMNEHFICIKVDREERPDVDNVYMDAVQVMTGRGGWPMSLFLTPDLKPFYAGTYFPPVESRGMPGFGTICRQLSTAWTTRREEVLKASNEIQGMMAANASNLVSQAEVAMDLAFVEKAYTSVAGTYDALKGGFGSAPKFPTPHKIRFLFRSYHRSGEQQALDMALRTLDTMAMGGIHDHLGGGFHRYSTDANWLVPHFEKMLYDQAGLALAYTDAWLVTGETIYQTVARDICDYVLEYMTHDKLGGFYSAEDADSEGEEGKFYVWQAGEVRNILGDKDGDAFLKAYQSSDLGNWEMVNILHTDSLDPLMDANLSKMRTKLLKERDKRIRPHLDDKIVTAWNGFMIEALAYAGHAFDEERYVHAAERAAEFLDNNLYDDTRLLRHYRNGPATIKAYVDDYAFFARGYLALYQATFKPRHLKRAKELATDMVGLFQRPQGGFNFQGTDQAELITPVIEVYDGAMPSGNSAAASVLLRVGHLTADNTLKDAGWNTVKLFSGTLDRGPSAYMEMISAADFALGPITEIILAGKSDKDVAPFVDALRGAYRPNTVMAVQTDASRKDAVELIPYLEAQGMLDGKSTAYVCRNYACQLPVHDVEGLARQLEDD